MKRNMKRLVDGAVTAALATTTVTLVGCADEIDLSGFEVAPCDRGVSDLNPAMQVDYVKLMSMSDFGTSEVFDSGTACATATDAQTCGEALEAAELDDDAWRTRLLTTAGDTLATYTSRDEVLAFLGPIDTPGEAVLLAWWDGYFIGCSELERGAVKAVGDGFEVIGTKMVQSCTPIETRQYRLSVSPTGEVKVLDDVQLEYDENSCVGRRPDGFERSEARGEDVCASFWSTTAHLEAAAVDAFETLAWELERFGAPGALVQRARDAAEDERRHARDTTRIAREFGGEFINPETPERRERTLLEFAVENMAEGCVRETFGAVVGAFQARAARRPLIAESMATIAREEAGHAALSWEIADWLESRLEAEELAEVEATKRRAIRALMAELRIPIPLKLVVDAGLPTPDQSRAMFDVMRAELWEPAAA